MYQTFKKPLKLLTLTLIFSILFISCDKEKSENQVHEHESLKISHHSIDELSELSNALGEINIGGGDSRMMNTSFGDLNLSDIIAFENPDGKETYTFKILNSQNLSSNIDFENLHLIKYPGDCGYLAYISHWESDPQWFSDNGGFDIKTFTGTYKKYDLNYTLLSEQELVNGVTISNNKSTNIDERTELWSCELIITCWCPGNPWCGCDGSWSCTTTSSSVCSISGGGTLGTTSGSGTTVGGSGPDADSPWNPSSSTVINPITKKDIVDLCFAFDAIGSVSLSPTQQVWYDDPDNSMFFSSFSRYIEDNGCTDESKQFIKDAIDVIDAGGEVDFENELILDESFVNDPKLKCVYDKLKMSNSNLFKATIGNFINDPKLKMTITKGNCINTDDACCDDSNITTTGVVNLKIEDTTGSVLDIASLILHEAIHAEISRYVLLQAPNEDVNDRPRILQLYKYYKNLYNEGSIEHIYMTEKYITPIAAALRKLDNFSYPIDYYKSYAWDGLRKWDAGSLLSMSEDSNYSNYRQIVETNTLLSCD